MAHPVVKATTPTSATSSKPSARPAGISRGFTLVELLVALAIGAMLVAFAPPAFDRLRESAQFRDTVRTMLSELRQARAMALSSGSDVAFQVDLEQRVFGIASGSAHAIPAALEIRTAVAQNPIGDARLAAILFLPSGGASGGSIDIVRPSGAGVRLQVDWLSGRIAQERL
jgi:general secretion pathway protein H